MRCRLLKLLPNRVRRNYRGGAGIDQLRGKVGAEDGDRPEERIASLVAAANPGLAPIPGEGLSACLAGGERRTLIDLFREAPDFYLGKELFRARGIDLGFLFKMLDSSMRLHVQAHPTADFARKRLASPYGKLECYYILRVRPGTRPYIRLGFQHAPTRDEWARIIRDQDIPAMDACFEPVPIEEGQVWFIPGGMPHAIGESVLMLEIMEPSDLVVRCEFEREGIVVPPAARFMGKDLDFCLDIFDYAQYSVEEIARKFRLGPVPLSESSAHRLERLVGREAAKSFEVRRLRLMGGAIEMEGGSPCAMLALNGEVQVSVLDERVRLGPGEGVFIAAEASAYEVRSEGGAAETCLVLPVIGD